MEEMIMTIFLKLLVALLLGALVGLEREWKRKPAGLKTHMLVCMGAADFTMVSIDGFQIDPARVAAGIVTGIGFIGAGTIIGSKVHVTGVTTAATLWIVAGIGLAVGAEMYITATISAALVFLVLELGKVERSIEKIAGN